MCQVKVHVLASISSFSHLCSVFLDRVIHFEANLGDKVRVRSLKKLKILIEVPNVVHVKVHVFSFNMILLSLPQRVLRSSYPFLGKFLAMR